MDRPTSEKRKAPLHNLQRRVRARKDEPEPEEVFSEQESTDEEDDSEQDSEAGTLVRGGRRRRRQPPDRRLAGFLRRPREGTSFPTERAAEEGPEGRTGRRRRRLGLGRAPGGGNQV
ncbi:hypothetical protein DL766_008220 [Monosporascus sp. MC13-8B]|nr:hypothetical protein DL766_008220 [Monosporascus sp. MC13-8B]